MQRNRCTGKALGRKWSFHVSSEVAISGNLHVMCSAIWKLAEHSPFGFLWSLYCIGIIANGLKGNPASKTHLLEYSL